MSSLKSFFKDTVIYGMASVLPRLISIGLIPIFTSVLDLRQFSDQTTWYVYAAFINVLLTMGLETAFFRFYTVETNKEKVLSTTFILMVFSSVVFAVLGTLIAPYVFSFLGFTDPIFIKVLVWITAIDTIVVIPFAYLRVTGRPIKFMFIKVLNVLIWFTFTALFLIILPQYLLKSGTNHTELLSISFDKPGVIHVVLANLLASIFTIVCLFPEIKKIKWKIDKSLVDKLLKYGMPIMIAGFAYVANENVDKLIIQKIINKDANGMYAACYKMGVFMTLYITAFRMGAEPFFFNHASSVDAKQKYSKIMTWFVIFGCLFMVFVVGFMDLLAGLIIKNPIYLPGLVIVPIILLANLFSGIYNNLAIWYKLTDRTHIGMYISILGAGLTIVSLLVLVPIFGILGGAFATLLTYFTMSLISYYFGNRYYPVGYEVKKITIHVFIATVLCALSFLVFRANYLVSTTFIIVYIMVVKILEDIKLSDIKKRI